MCIAISDAYLAAFFCAAHLLRWASAIRSRASRLSTLLAGAAFMALDFLPPPPEVLLRPASKARAWVKRDISSSITEISCDVCIGLLRIATIQTLCSCISLLDPHLS